MLIPTVIQKTYNNQYAFDIFSRLLESRIIFLYGPIDDNVSSVVVAQLLHLENENPEADIQMYVQSPGGSITAGLAIIDAMNHVKCDVCTIGVGVAASMGAVILASGEKGKRFILPNAEVMIHQPLGGVEGQASDIKIAADRIMRRRDVLYDILAEATGKPVKEIIKDSDRDKWLTAPEAVKYGLVDKIVESYSNGVKDRGAKRAPKKSAGKSK